MHLQQKFCLKHSRKILCRLSKSNITNQPTSSTILHLRPYVFEAGAPFAPCNLFPSVQRSFYHYWRLHWVSEQFYPTQPVFQVCGNLLLSPNASLVPQAANEMEAYLRKIKKNSNMFFMLGFHSISNKQKPAQKCSPVPKSEVPLRIVFIKTKVNY